MRRLKTDLHIHTCLSPCADLEMSPKAVVEMGLKRGLDLIAICDHNSAENVGAAMRAGVQKGLHVLPGMEISSKEEVHTLAVFDSERQALAMQEIVYDHLKGSNRPDVFGDQVVANEFDEVEGFNDRLLIGATQLELYEVVKEIHRLGGVSIASHVDRASFSLLAQLGFVPPGVELDAFEIADPKNMASVRKSLSDQGYMGFLSGSDAHFLKDIGKRYTSFFVRGPEVSELRMAFIEESGRKVERIF